MPTGSEHRVRGKLSDRSKWPVLPQKGSMDEQRLSDWWNKAESRRHSDPLLLLPFVEYRKMAHTFLLVLSRKCLYKNFPNYCCYRNNLFTTGLLSHTSNFTCSHKLSTEFPCNKRRRSRNREHFPLIKKKNLSFSSVCNWKQGHGLQHSGA